MARLRQRSFFLFLVVLLFALGHAHQVAGRFYAHHHDADLLAGHSHDESTTDQGDHQGDAEQKAEHQAEHLAMVAVMPSLLLPQPVQLNLLSPVIVSATPAQPPRAVGIDHPPQLLG